MKSPNESWRSPEALEPLPADFYQSSAEVVAERLLGKVLLVRHGDAWLGAEIVETEAYHQEDPASHSFCGVTGRSWPMFEAGGVCYVYLIYGINYCVNVVTGRKNRGEAVLLRAGRPILGIEIMRANRGAAAKKDTDLLSGPGKLTQALGIGPQYNGLTFHRPDFKLVNVSQGSGEFIRTPRIGISKAREELLRFHLRHSPYISKTRFSKGS